MIAILATTLALAIAPQPIAHTVTVQHQSAPLNATYKADVEVTTRQIGMAAGPRAGTARCLWQARVGVIREVAREQGPAYSRRLDADKLVEGSRAGSCETVTRQLERDLAARQGDVRAHVEQVAQRDQDQLRADLRTLTELAQN
jgi:hypothetical protein